MIINILHNNKQLIDAQNQNVEAQKTIEISLDFNFSHQFIARNYHFLNKCDDKSLFCIH